jgi:hypothetical protein
MLDEWAEVTRIQKTKLSYKKNGLPLFAFCDSVSGELGRMNARTFKQTEQMWFVKPEHLQKKKRFPERSKKRSKVIAMEKQRTQRKQRLTQQEKGKYLSCLVKESAAVSKVEEWSLCQRCVQSPGKQKINK